MTHPSRRVSPRLVCVCVWTCVCVLFSHSHTFSPWLCCRHAARSREEEREATNLFLSDDRIHPLCSSSAPQAKCSTHSLNIHQSLWDTHTHTHTHTYTHKATVGDLGRMSFYMLTHCDSHSVQRAAAVCFPFTALVCLSVYETMCVNKGLKEHVCGTVSCCHVAVFVSTRQRWVCVYQPSWQKQMLPVCVSPKHGYEACRRFWTKNISHKYVS